MQPGPSRQPHHQPHHQFPTLSEPDDPKALQDQHHLLNRIKAHRAKAAEYMGLAQSAPDSATAQAYIAKASSHDATARAFNESAAAYAAAAAKSKGGSGSGMSSGGVGGGDVDMGGMGMGMGVGAGMGGFAAPGMPLGPPPLGMEQREALWTRLREEKALVHWYTLVLPPSQFFRFDPEWARETAQRTIEDSGGFIQAMNDMPWLYFAMPPGKPCPIDTLKEPWCYYKLEDAGEARLA